MRAKPTTPLPPLIADSLFLLGTVTIILFALSCLRGILLFRNYELATSATGTELLNAFLIGIRFDLIITTYISIPLVIALLLPKGLHPRGLFASWSIALGSLLLFLGVLELDFYHEFHARLNSMVFQYIREDASTVVSMIWYGFPVL